VLAANLLGALLLSIITARTPSLDPAVRAALLRLGTEAALGSFSQLFWSGVIGGWLVALVAWLVSASHDTVSQIAVTWLLTFVLGIGGFAHSVASGAEILTAVVSGRVGTGDFVGWLVPAVLGNIVGGVFIVSLLNYGQSEH
jgi:formate-nitrite transporter family protein